MGDLEVAPGALVDLVVGGPDPHRLGGAPVRGGEGQGLAGRERRGRVGAVDLQPGGRRDGDRDRAGGLGRERHGVAPGRVLGHRQRRRGEHEPGGVVVGDGDGHVEVLGAAVVAAAHVVGQGGGALAAGVVGVVVDGGDGDRLGLAPVRGREGQGGRVGRRRRVPGGGDRDRHVRRRLAVEDHRVAGHVLGVVLRRRVVGLAERERLGRRRHRNPARVHDVDIEPAGQHVRAAGPEREEQVIFLDREVD